MALQLREAMVVTAALHIAGNDLVRFLRRRDTFWIVAIAMASQLLLASVAATLLVGDAGASWTVLLFLRSARAAEWVALGVLAYYVTFFGERQDLEGAWVLLKLVPAPSSRLLLGKLLGGAAACLVLHAALVLPLVVVPEAHGSLADLVWPWLYAVTLIPEAIFLARVHAAGRWRYAVGRLLTVARLGMPLLLLLLAVRAVPSGRPLGEIAIALALSIIGVDPRPPSTFFPPHLGPLPIVLGWQLLSAIPLVLLLRRGR